MEGFVILVVLVIVIALTIVVAVAVTVKAPATVVVVMAVVRVLESRGAGCRTCRGQHVLISRFEEEKALFEL